MSLQEHRGTSSCYACSIFTVNRTSENRNEWCSGDQKAWENVIKCLPGLLCNFMYQVAFYICRLYMYIHIYTHTWFVVQLILNIFWWFLIFFISQVKKQSIFYPLKLMFVLRKTKAVNNLKQGSIWLLTYDQDIHLHFNTFGTLTCTQIVFAFYLLRSQFSKSSYFVRIHKMKNTPQKRYPEMPAEIFFFAGLFQVVILQDTFHPSEID